MNYEQELGRFIDHPQLSKIKYLYNVVEIFYFGELWVINESSQLSKIKYLYNVVEIEMVNL